MKFCKLTQVQLIVLLSMFSLKGFAQCTFTEANLIGAPPSFTVPAGQVLCINANFCMGAASNFPGACANSAVNSLIIDGTLRIGAGVTFRFAGSIAGTGKVQILQGGRINLFGSVNCGSGLSFSAIDQALVTGTSASTALVSCSSPACEPKFANNYAPFGVVTPGLGYTSAGCLFITGFPNNALLLPVSLLNFAVRRDAGGVLLSWKTASEQNNAGFDVQRSLDGRSWENAGHVSSSAPGGNSNTIISYSFRDQARIVSTMYYRLKQVDINGMMQLSNVVLVKETTESDVRIASVPGVINLDIYSGSNQQMQVKVVGPSGGIVYRGSYPLTAGQKRISINTSNFAKGIYFVILQNGKESKQEKVRVQ